MARGPRIVTTGWAQLLRRDGRGATIVDLGNMMIVLRANPDFNVCFEFDEMQQAIVVRAPPPICQGADPGGELPRFADPEDITRLQEWMHTVGGLKRLGRETVSDGLNLFARERSVHPLRTWLRTREIGVRQPVLENWLTYALGVPNDAYHRAVGQMFIIAMVARILEPGCQADYMLVLEGPQGEEKSAFCRMLAGPEYFSDHIPTIDGDQIRASMHMRGKWLIEISELAAISKADVEVLKSFITRRTEIYVPKYGRNERREPRQCLFIGTTNTDDWIKDETGGRRFWPVKVDHVDLDWLAEFRDQLFAEAVEAYDAGLHWWPDRLFEKRVIAPHQAKRQSYDAWEETIRDFIEFQQTTTIMAIGFHLTQSSGRVGMIEQKRIATILKKLKWTKGQNSRGHAVWRKPQE
jgi:predicted P-loop ATPase